MYDDAWFATVPAAPVRPEVRHIRRVSLLEQPNEDDLADVSRPDQSLLVTLETDDQRQPPRATVARRAKSYTDFHYASRSLRHRQQPILGQHSIGQKSRRASEVVEEDLHAIEQDDTVADELLEASHGKYQLYLDELQTSRRHLDSLLKDADANLELLSSLTRTFNGVEAQAAAFQARCESLLTEQRRLSSLADDVEHNLQYYNYLDPITRRLNAPGVRHFVRSDDFTGMLAQLDECLEYMKKHPGQREASTYGSRYRLLLTRGLTLIRVYFTDTLRSTAAEVSQRIADRQLNDTTMPALLYAKFRVNAADLKRLAFEIQKRAVPDPSAGENVQAEYQSLVNELHQSYGAARGRLIIPLVRRKMDEISLAPSTSKDLVAFARSSISYIRGICMDEFELWHEWFDGDDGLYAFLETVCEPLYDYLRPRTIRETQLSKLCEMCTLIQARYMEEGEEEFDNVDRQQLDFSGLILPTLEDSQSRLVFVTLAVLRDDIERFKPGPEDLNYPARIRSVPLSGTKTGGPALSGRKGSTQAPPVTVKDAGKGHDGENRDVLDVYDAPEAFQGWYPTLQKAIWLLINGIRRPRSSNLYASKHISAKTSPIDGQLFLLRQLLILKQQIVAFDIEFVTPEIDVDFSGITSTFWELRERGGLFNATNLVRLLGNSLMPRVVENMLDAKAELDAQLRTVIGHFTTGFADRMTSAVSDSAVSTSDFNAAKAVQILRKSVEREVKILRQKLDEYLEDPRTKNTLAGAIQDQAVSNYEDFFDRHANMDGASRTPTSPNKGKGRGDDVWDADTFADWMTTIFGVGNADLIDETGGSSPSLSRTASA
ncbi:MAG: hypothetical protein Q9162_003417 [Coniocarpon cinnabarinum]